MDKIILSGYISVRTALEAKSRKIYKIILDRERYDSVSASKLRESEKRQYEALKRFDVPIEFIDKETFRTICRGETSGGICAEAGERENLPLGYILEKSGYIVVLDGIEDPYNFGYVLRTLYAAGVDGIVLPERDYSGADEIIVRSSAGASELLKICVCPDLAEAVREIKQKGFFIACTANENKSVSIYRAYLKKPFCLIFGGEKRGISASVIGSSDILIKLPYPRRCNYSLAASSAVSIISFEIAKKLKAYDFKR